MSHQITFKIYFKDQIRRITLPPPSFSQMVLFLSQIIPGDYRITYYDCDGDHITITSQIEWECALLEAKDKSVFRLLLEAKTGAEDLQLHQSFFASVARAKSAGNEKQRSDQVDQERKKLELELRKLRLGEEKKVEEGVKKKEEEEKVEEEKQRKVEQEEAKKRAEEQAKRKAEGEKRAQEEEEKKKAEEAETKKRAEEEAKRKAEEEKRAQEEEEKKAAEEVMKKKAEEMERRRAEELAKFAEERRVKLEEEAKKREEKAHLEKLIDSVIEARKHERAHDPNHEALLTKWKNQIEQLKAMGFEVTPAQLRQLDSVQGSLVAFLESEYP